MLYSNDISTIQSLFVRIIILVNTNSRHSVNFVNQIFRVISIVSHTKFCSYIHVRRSQFHKHHSLLTVHELDIDFPSFRPIRFARKLRWRTGAGAVSAVVAIAVRGWKLRHSGVLQRRCGAARRLYTRGTTLRPRR